MLKKLNHFLQRLCLFFLIGFIGLPFSMLVIPHASAKTATATAKATSSAVAVTQKPVVQKMAFNGVPSGLFRSSTYVPGQIISFQIVISGEPTIVWADASKLDLALPSKIILQNIGQNTWELRTPKLSDNLNVGGQTITVFAQNTTGQIIQSEVKVNLQKLSTLKVASYRVKADGKATVDWYPVSWADKYLVGWQEKGVSASHQFMIVSSHILTINSLLPGKNYEVTIQALRGEAIGNPVTVSFKTLGESLVLEVNGVSTTSKENIVIAPTIGSGLSNKRQVSAVTPKPAESTTPKVEASPTLSPSPSSSPETGSTETGSWNKLLVAISILIIAAAAAIGGYYGYEWFIGRSKDDEESSKPKSNSSNSRW